MRCGAVIYPTVLFGAVLNSRKSYGAVRCGFGKYGTVRLGALVLAVCLMSSMFM